MHRTLRCLAGLGVSLPEAGSEPILGAASSMRDEEEAPAMLFLLPSSPPPRSCSLCYEAMRRKDLLMATVPLLPSKASFMQFGKLRRIHGQDPGFGHQHGFLLMEPTSELLRALWPDFLARGFWEPQARGPAPGTPRFPSLLTAPIPPLPLTCV